MFYFFIQNASPRWDESGLRTGGREMTISSSDILVISSYILERSSECRRIVLYILAEAIQGVHAETLSFYLFVAGAVFGEVGGWLYLHGHDISYVTPINHEIHFAWQAQYLVSLKGDCTCFAHCK